MDEQSAYAHREFDKHYAKIERLEQTVLALSIKLEQRAAISESNKQEIATIKKDLSEVREDVGRLLDVLNRSKGVVWLALSMAAALGVVVSWLIAFFKD